MEQEIFTRPSKKRQKVGGKVMMALRAESINRVLLRAIERIQEGEIEGLAKVARKV